ncbi:hypothetical protein EGW08_015712 [Elysia chlorotica]|uniref:YLP motif-containing protein 1 n=1 Tax=Elysia chlorotica TaxID=188477 RepID=A0A433T4J6_ELYCH|nr:hypothetical protein EGW08_015712 [Elysia chlorotica]
MFNWNNQIRGQGFPVQNPPAVQMMSYGAPGQPFAAAMQFQAAQWGHQQQQQFPQGIGMVPMMGQQHAQWQQVHQFAPQHQQGMFHHPGMRMGMMGGMNPTPPSYPPPEEKPPLPSEPPPPLPSTPHEAKPPLPNEQPKPPLPKEEIGRPHNDGPRPPDEPAPEKPAPPARPPSPDPELLAELEKVKKEEEVFLDQYKQWKKQYDDWRDQNQNHPNKDQYEQYLNQWKTYEGQMESRRISIAKQKESLEKKVAEHRQFSQTRPASSSENQNKFSPHKKEQPGFLKSQGSNAGNYSPGGPGVRTPTRKTNPVRDEENSQNRQPGHHPIEGDDIGEEDMNLDDEEEMAGGGIIESSSHPPSHEAWSNNRSSNIPASSSGEHNNMDNEHGDKLWHSQNSSGYGGPSRFPGGDFSGESRFPGAGGPEQRFPGGRGRGEPRFPGRPGGEESSFSSEPFNEEQRFPGRPFGEDSRFSGGPQEWEQSGAGPSNFPRGRGRGERGMFGQGPRFGWRGGGGGPRFQGPPGAERGGGFSEQEDTQWEDYERPDAAFQEDTGEEKADETEYADQETWYGETDSESQVYDEGTQNNFPNAGRGFFPNRGRGGPGAFQRGRGSEGYGTRGAGFERGRGGAFGRGEPMRGGPGRFPRGRPSFMGRGAHYNEDETETNFYNTPEEFGPNRGRGTWSARGRGGFKGPPPHQYPGDVPNNDVGEENHFDDVELQAQLQYDGEEELGNQEHDNFQPGFRGRGRGGMLRGRGRGGFEGSFDNERISQNEDSQYNAQDSYGYENPQTGFGHRGRGVHLGETFRGRGRGEMNFGNEGMGRGFQRGRGAFRGRGGHMTNFQEDYKDGEGDVEGGDQFQDQSESYPVQPAHSYPRGRGRGSAVRPGFGCGAFADESNDQYPDDNEAYQWNEESSRQAALGRGLGIRPGMGRGAVRLENPEDRWNNEPEALPEGSVYENRRAEKNTLFQQGVENDDEPVIKRSRFDTDERDPYGRLPPRDRFDVYGDRFHDPYDRFPDSYPRDPYFDPYAPSPYERLPGYDMYGGYDRTLPEKKSFMPAESIDYGHGEADKEKKKAALQQKEVIDYGHGRASEPRDDPSVLPERKGSRPPEDIGFDRGRGWDKDDRQRNFPNDNLYRASQGGRIVETYDYSNLSGQDPSSKKEFSDEHSARERDSRYSVSARRSEDPALDYDHRDRDDRSRDIGQDPEKPTGDRRIHPDDPYSRNRFGLQGRDADDRTKADFGDSNDRSSSNRYGRYPDNRHVRDGDDRYSRDREDRYGRDRENRFDRDSENRPDGDKDDRYGKISSDIHDRNAPFSGGRDKEDPYKERDRNFSRGLGRDDSPRRRTSDLDERYGGRRGSPFKKDEDLSKGRDPMRREDGSNRLTDFRDQSYFRGRDDQADPYSSLDRESVRNLDSNSGMNKWDDRDPYSMTSARDQRFGAMLGARDLFGDRPGSSPARNSPVVRAPAAPPSLPVAEVKKVEDLLCPPGRQSRPPQLVVIIRGLPGSGKTYVSKLLREKEIKFGGSAPRMLCLDDYFMVEVDKQEKDPDTGKKVKRKVLEYEYEQPLEDAYRQSLLKSFKKTVDDGFFPFIIVDATNEKVVHFSEFWSYAKSRGFQVYVGELSVDTSTCIQRNIHNWTEWDIEKVKSNWEPLPNHYIRLDLRWLLQDDSIDEVEMEDTDPNEAKEEKEADGEEKDPEDEEEESGSEGIYKKSKWELDSSEKTLDKLDGIPVSKKHIAEHQSLKDYLQLDQPDQLDDDDDYYSRESLPGKKRVRWADLEEKKTQNRRRDLGFIVGQTQRDWDRITDDDFAAKALNQTKYFYKN